MIRINKWQGLVTYASAYLLPPGGAVEQINACSYIPGQLTVRGGMEEAMTTTGAALEMWGFNVGPGTDKVFVFTDSGDILIENPPAI